MPNSIRTIFLAAALLFVFNATANATIVCIDLTGTTASGGLFDFDNSSGTFTDPTTGLVLSFSTADGDLNANASSFGVNAPGGSDEASQLDGDSGTDEAFSVSVSGAGISSVFLTEMTVTSFGASDLGTLTQPFTISPVLSGNGTVIPPVELLGSAFSVSYDAGTEGNGFGISELKFDVQFSAVPEPTTLAMFGTAMILGLRRRR